MDQSRKIPDTSADGGKGAVVLAMSGGVDSSVAAVLLSRAGYDVRGVTFLMHGDDDAAAAFLSYESGTISNKAREVCAALGIPHESIDLRERFRADVIVSFTNSYATGETPNPCVECNRNVKLRSLLEYADKTGADFIATGHYACVIKHEPTGRYTFAPCADEAKDQSYMLYSLPQDILSRLLLPLSDLKKEQVRELAAECGLPCSDEPDSQDICFIPDGDYAAYLGSCGVEFTEGAFLDTDGDRVGTHEGIARYTCGQRKGLGAAFGTAMYVVEKDPEKNTVTIGGEEDLYKDVVYIDDLYFTAVTEIKEKTRVSVKLRYTPHTARAFAAPCGKGLLIRFDEPQRAPTPGQHCVLYADGVMLCGGRIVKAYALKPKAD